MTPEEAESFRRCIAAGGVVLFPADTVYGLAADPESESAVQRLYELKGRPPAQPAAVMFFALEAALAALPALGDRTRAALARLLPGGLTVILPNADGRYPLACGPHPQRIGLRVPEPRGALAALAGASWPVLQSSANLSGGPDARRLEDVEASLRSGVDLALDGGELPGTPSTVLDLTGYEEGGEFAVLRPGAVSRETIDAAL